MDPTRGMRRVFKRLEARDARRQAREEPLDATSASAEDHPRARPPAEAPARRVDMTPVAAEDHPTAGSQPQPLRSRPQPPTRARSAPRPRHGAPGRRSAGTAFNDLVAARRQQTDNRPRTAHERRPAPVVALGATLSLIHI